MNVRQARVIVDERAARLQLPHDDWLKPRPDDGPEFAEAVAVLLSPPPDWREMRAEVLFRWYARRSGEHVCEGDHSLLTERCAYCRSVV